MRLPLSRNTTRDARGGIASTGYAHVHLRSYRCASIYAATDALKAYLFQCGDNGLYAVSLDPSGRNIPRDSCFEGWQLKTEFLLGVHEPVPASIAPEPILQGLRNVGYYVWREGAMRATTR